MFKLLLISTLVFVSFSLHCQNDIHAAVREGNLKVVKKLVKKDITIVNTLNAKGHSPLNLAVYNNKEDVARLLIEKGANINYKMDMGSAVHAVAFKGNSALLKLLIDNQADIDALDNNNTSALHYAVLGNHLACVKILLENNAIRNSKDATGKTAFDYAKELGNKEILTEFNKKRR